MGYGSAVAVILFILALIVALAISVRARRDLSASRRAAADMATVTTSVAGVGAATHRVRRAAGTGLRYVLLIAVAAAIVVPIGCARRGFVDRPMPDPVGLRSVVWTNPPRS
jgi:hypothetical protein